MIVVISSCHWLMMLSARPSTTICVCVFSWLIGQYNWQRFIHTARLLTQPSLDQQTTLTWLLYGVIQRSAGEPHQYLNYTFAWRQTIKTNALTRIPECIIHHQRVALYFNETHNYSDRSSSRRHMVPMLIWVSSDGQPACLSRYLYVWLAGWLAPHHSAAHSFPRLGGD